MRALNVTRGTVVGEQICVADGLLSRMIGLLGKSSLAPGAGLLIRPSQGVHTIGMMFTIDLLFLDRNFRVTELRQSLRPFRMTGLNWRAQSVLELPVNSIELSRTAIGDQLVIEPAVFLPGNAA
ncbi:MAG: DUF192 domain-containing protein [Acidobacteriia bacterium]|nr:DUF192 domain-containing protein [Terriglobia bacterium]